MPWKPRTVFKLRLVNNWCLAGGPAVRYFRTADRGSCRRRLWHGRRARVSWTVLLAGAGLVAVTVIGVLLVLWFVDDQRERDLRAWQVRMGIVADSRFAAVNDWFERQFAQVREVAENASVQLYLTGLAMFEGDATLVTDEPAQRT